MVAVSAVSVAAKDPRHATGHQDGTRILDLKVKFQGATRQIRAVSPLRFRSPTALWQVSREPPDPSVDRAA
jgi:hypothetical protein